jgi:hypothetical protein
MQWSFDTEGQQKNELAQKEFHFIKTIIIKRVAITCSPSPLNQRCTAAKDGKFQGGLRQQTKSAECDH